MIKGIGKRLSTYCGRIGLEKSMLAGSFALILIALIGGSMAATTGSLVGPGSYEEKNITFDFEQSVQGNGYFMTYLYAKAGNVAVKNYAHGSGSLNSEATLTYQQLDRTKHHAIHRLQ